MLRAVKVHYKHLKKAAAVFLVSALSAGLVSCAGVSQNEADIISQKKTEAGRTPVTVLVKYAFSINAFEKAVEEKFPDIDLIQVGNYTGALGIDEYEARLKNDDLTDIVMTWPLDVGNEYWEDRLLELSGMDFTSKYNTSMLNDISTGGKLYYIPGPAQVRGIIYNKTLFREKGWEVPKDFEGFITLCKTIEESGIRAIQLGFSNPEVLDTAFIGYNYSSSYSKPKDKKWLEDFNNGTGDYGEQFSGALDVFERMIEEGIWKPEDMNIDYSDREKMMFNRECAMVEDSVLMCRMGFPQTGITDEFALMPFFNPDGSDWARIYMVCYIGINKHMAEPDNKDKYEMIMKLMDYISTPEGQNALMEDTGAMFSSVKGTGVPDVPEIEDLRKALENARYAVFPELKNSQGALRRGLAGMVRGTASKNEVIMMVNDQNKNPPGEITLKTIGEALEDFSMIDTGNFVTDAMRSYTGCDFALFMDNGKDGRYNGKGISARLYKGGLTTKDIKRVMPDLKSGDTEMLCKVTMTGKDLIATLEHSIPVDNNTGWFYYFSGLKMEYDPLAEPGSRIKSIMTADNKTIEPEKEYSIALMHRTAREEFYKTHEELDVTVSEVVTQAITNAQTIAPAKDRRFKIPE